MVVQCVIERLLRDSGTFSFCRCFASATGGKNLTEAHMHGLIYLIGLIVVIMAILSLFGLR
jgi:hypothetical protein